MKYQVITKDGRAKRAQMETVHGTIQTPVFMNVGTVGAIKGAVSTDDLRQIGTQVELSNTYHLHVRTGDKLIKEYGGLHQFMNWDKPILTDSGGFQVFSLTDLRKIKEEGVYFRSHIDGHKIFMGPEESMQIQSNLGSTIAMAFDECPPSHADYDYIRNSVDRTTRWLKRCKTEMDRLNSLPDTINKEQLLFGINQGGVVDEIRIQHAETIKELDLDGYAIGGLAVGETHEEMYHILDVTVPHLPEDKPVYLMGVGTPANILEAVERGVDFFDCVYPSRNGRHGHVYTNHGKMSKSKGEFLTVSLLEEKGYDPLAYRFFCLQSHYRKSLVFTWENLDNAAAAYGKLIAKIAALNPEDGTVDEAALKEYKEKFLQQMGNDLNTSMGVTALYDALKAKTNDATKLAILDSFDTVLSLSLLKKAASVREANAKAQSAKAEGGYTVTGEGDPAIDALVMQRYEAKKSKNFAEADRIRDELKAQGIEIVDTKDGASWKRI